MGDISKRRFDPAEDALIREGFYNGVTDKQIVEVLAAGGFQRSYYAIYARRKTLGLVHQTSRIAEQASKPKPPADAAFVRAMLAAINSGEEKAILGVVKDRRPLSLKRYQPEPVKSGCSSSAGWGVSHNSGEFTELTYR